MATIYESLAPQAASVALDVLHSPSSLGNRGIGAGLMSGIALTALAAGAIAGDELLTRRRPLRTTPLLEVIPPADGKTTRVVAGYAPGFNSHPRSPGNIYAQIAREYGAVLIEHDPETGYDAEQSHVTFAEKCQELEAEEVLLIGDSAGGKKQLSLATYLIRECGINTSVTQVSTPNLTRHIKGRQRRAMLAFLDVVDRMGIRGGDGFRQGAEMIGYRLDNPHKSYRECRAHLDRKFKGSKGAVTSPQVIKYAPLLRRYNAVPDLKMLGPNRVRFASADDPARDPVVRIQESHDFLEEHTGGAVAWNQLPRLGHANVCEVPGAAHTIVRWSFAQAGILSISERRAKIA